jgi:hypothetical protein
MSRTLVRQVSEIIARGQARYSVEEEIYLLRELALARRAAAFDSFRKGTLKRRAANKTDWGRTGAPRPR